MRGHQSRVGEEGVAKHSCTDSPCTMSETPCEREFTTVAVSAMYVGLVWEDCRMVKTVRFSIRCHVALLMSTVLH
uniref:Uncharacterized protein n=1 Tax=Physcomitrium patens TaxID=3218 RepID=A0A2K1IXS0_PHYPA|nr:hypothetical protein PHYPA_023890 [Physcomitrium patens]